MRVSIIITRHHYACASKVQNN